MVKLNLYKVALCNNAENFTGFYFRRFTEIRFLFVCGEAFEEPEIFHFFPKTTEFLGNFSSSDIGKIIEMVL